MRIGLFLDVDKVLTEEPINVHISKLLNVRDQFQQIEEAFTRTGNNDEFNRGLIPLFKAAGFNRDFIKDNFNVLTTNLRTNHERLLKLPIDTYLISSGPSYFVEELASRHNIPETRVLCSKYSFSRDGDLQACTFPVSGPMKGDFVRRHAAKYDVCIGVGDNKLQDNSFLSHCGIPIIFGQNLCEFEYLTTREIQPIIEIVTRLRARVDPSQVGLEKHVANLLETSPFEKNVFIMTPFKKDARYQLVIKSIQTILANKGFRGWIASERNFAPQLWENVSVFMAGCEFGIAVFTKENLPGSGDESTPDTYNPNVSVEVGYMLALGRRVLLLKEKSLLRLPTDILSFLYEDFNIDDPEKSLDNAIEAWLRND